jgi:hypothetical protein
LCQQSINALLERLVNVIVLRTALTRVFDKWRNTLICGICRKSNRDFLSQGVLDADFTHIHRSTGISSLILIAFVEAVLS